MSEPRLLSRREDGVLRLTLNRPDKRNAIDSHMVTSLLEALERADLDSEVRVVTLQGAGEDFCAGADLKEMLDSVDQPSEEHRQHAMQLGEVFIRMRELPKPVLALVHGRALAGGCGLASACDMVLASESAQFGYPEVKRGFVPAMVIAMLVRAVGQKRALGMVATGQVYPAREAMELGLVTRVFPESSFSEDAAALVSELATSSATALALIKKQVYSVEGLGFREAIEHGASVNALARSTEDFRKAVSSFLKRK